MSFKTFSSFDNGSRVDKFRKEEIFEKLLQNINEGEDFSIEDGTSYPPIIIIAAPRSGSTFLNQLMAARLNIGYVSNLMACFYEKPIIGALMQRKLIGESVQSLTKFKSDYGVTESVNEPHEFGYFWSRHLHFSETCHQPTASNQTNNIDWKNLKNELSDISKVFSRPTVFKCSIGCFLLEELINHVPCLVINIVRNKEANIASIIRGRKDRLGSEEKWWSVRPAYFEKMASKSPYEQVEWQYESIQSAINKAVETRPNNILQVSLQNLLASEETTLNTIQRKYEELYEIKIELREK